jgi:antitoxin (DNA-binding transcriptional repressor) of toxin-antitoxin stability system
MTTDETKVGIRELKSHLSHYVRLARGGRRIVVTDRGEEVAELRAVTPAHPGLRELIDSGMVTWSGGKPKMTPMRIHVVGEPLSETVLKMRDRDDPLP